MLRLGERNCDKVHFPLNIPYYNTKLGARGGVVVKALRYKPAGRGFDSRWCNWNFSGRTMALGSTQPLTEMSTRCNFLGVKAVGA
jgi:hypothetical protein